MLLGCVGFAHAHMVTNSGFNLPPHDFKQPHVGNECRKLIIIIWITDMWHNVHTKFYEFLPSPSLVIKYIKMDMGFGCIGRGKDRLCLRMRRR
jgi:hypothetical protein